MNEVTTFCALWRLDLSSGSSLFLTDHDDVISYEGQPYLPNHAADERVAESRPGLSVDSGGLRTSLTLPNISLEAIRGGALDGAKLTQYRHDWRSGETGPVSKGRIGEGGFAGDEMTGEWIGQARLLGAPTGRGFCPQWDARLGGVRRG